MPGYQIKVTMEGTKPPMWRRLLLPNKLSFADLHRILQIAFGWDDYHMHDFTFQHCIDTVGNTEYHDYADLDENETAADNYLKGGWIRYTYDYGDDWQHKIVLEKELEDYEERYPQVVKFKGNNFEEDSGGVWGGKESTEAYDMEAVNERLKEYCICTPVEPVAGEGDFLNLQETEKLMKKLFKNLQKTTGKKQTIQNQKKKSALDQKIEKIRDFCEKAEMVRKEENPAEQGGQLAFDFDTGKTEIEPEDPDYVFFKCGGNVTQSELLEQASEQLILDYQKYMMLPMEEKRRKQKAKEAILAALQENPSWYLIIFDEDTVKDYQICVEAKQGERLPYLREKSVVMLCAWGLLDAHVIKENGKTRMEIITAEGAEAFLHFVKTAGLPRFYGTKKLITDGIQYLMKSYGLMELPVLHAKYQKVFGPISYEELMRYLYLDGTLYGDYTTGEGLIHDVQVPFAAIKDLDVNEIFNQRNEYAQELDYADFKNRRLLKWKEGIAGFVPVWDELAELLNALKVVYEEELDQLLPELYLFTISGMELDEILFYIEENFFEEPEAPENKLLLAMIWKSMAKCWLETPIACLKGHNRMEASRLMKKEPFLVAVDEEVDVTTEELDGREQIYELPWKMQQTLYSLLELPPDKKWSEQRKRELQKIKKEAGRELEILDILEKFLAFDRKII